LAVFGRSDLAPGIDPLWYRWAVVACAHILLGIGLSLTWRWAAWVGLALLLAKELAFDLPGADWATVVILDSLADFVAVLAGLALGRWIAARPTRTRDKLNSGDGEKSGP
jgi:hypothetical protein